MPGMMDTVLNLALNDKTVEALAEMSGDRRFAYDSYRRFITMYWTWCSLRASSLRGHSRYLQGQPGLFADTDLTGDDWVDLVGRYKDGGGARTGHDSAGPLRAIVGRDWRGILILDERARGDLPRLHAFRNRWGTAVNVQAMVFGNMGETSATGLVHAHPSTGESKLYGEFLINAQGEGRGGGHSHAAGHHRICAPGIRLRTSIDGNRDARGVQGV